MSMHPFFDKVKLPKIQRNLFDKSFENKFSGNMGVLIPILCEDIVPGDKYRISPEILVRTAPMLAPIMHRVDIYTHTFFVPKRILWNEYESYITGGKDGSLQPVKPYFTYKQVASASSGAYHSLLRVGSLLDYMGLPPISASSVASDVQSEVKIDALPFRAYQQIFNDYYRDQNLSNEVDFSKSSGQVTDFIKLLSLRNRCWHKDYFTSALPFAQRGPEVSLPIGTSASVSGTLMLDDPRFSTQNTPVVTENGEIKVVSSDRHAYVGYTTPTVLDRISGQVSGLTADLSSATAVTINALRRASALQKFLERSALGGSRMIEANFAQFGIMGKDYRYQRAEYLGGSCQNLMISEVLQNSISEATSAQSGQGALGSMAGHGLSAFSNKPITKFFDEQGYLITILSVIPRASYQQGIPRMFSKFDRLDEYFPTFAHLGEQEVLKQEVYFDASASDASVYNNSTFGYQSRYCDMKYRSDEVHGDFRDSLDFWHMGRKFAGSGSSYESTSKPTLSNSFVTCSPTNRIFNVTSDNVHKLWFDCFIKIKALRPMPVFSTPSF